MPILLAVTSSSMGIGSVISSVLYNMLSEALEKPVTDASFSKDFEWDIAYVFPLVVIAFIQLVLILAFLSQWGVLPNTFLNLYLFLQNVADNNLYRVLGCSLLVMSIYPFVLKPENVNKIQGGAIAGIGLVFLARGFVDLGNTITDIYDDIFIYFDFPIALITFILLVFVIVRIILAANKSNNEITRGNADKIDIENVRVRKVHNPRHQTINSRKTHYNKPARRSTKERYVPQRDVDSDVQFKKHSNIEDNNQENIINQSYDNIQFESNDLLDDYKK